MSLLTKKKLHSPGDKVCSYSESVLGTLIRFGKIVSVTENLEGFSYIVKYNLINGDTFSSNSRRNVQFEAENEFSLDAILLLAPVAGDDVPGEFPFHKNKRIKEELDIQFSQCDFVEPLNDDLESALVATERHSLLDLIQGDGESSAEVCFGNELTEHLSDKRVLESQIDLYMQEIRTFLAKAGLQFDMHENEFFLHDIDVSRILLPKDPDA